MKSEEIKALQAPLKELYKQEPQKSMITLSSEGTLGNGITCSIQTGKALVEAGLHPATCGTGTFACSGDMLLDSLAACAGVTMCAVAAAIEVEIKSGKVFCEGDLDFRGTLGVSKEVPVGFQNIRLRFELDTDASKEQLATLLKLTERYCVVFQTLKKQPELFVTCKVSDNK